MWTKTIVSVVLLVAIATAASGCLAVAVGAGAAGTVAYLSGDLEAEEPHDIDTVYTAARKAAEDLELHIIEAKTGKELLKDFGL